MIIIFQLMLHFLYYFSLFGRVLMYLSTFIVMELDPKEMLTTFSKSKDSSFLKPNNRSKSLGKKK